MMINNKEFGQSDWGDFANKFKQSASPNMNSSMELDFSKLGDFIQNSMNEILSSNLTTQNFTTSSNSNVFETHDYMIVKIPVPENVNISDINVFLDTNMLMVTGASDKREYITLPINGNFAGSQGYYKDGIIEIRVPKNEKKNFREIMIKHL